MSEETNYIYTDSVIEWMRVCTEFCKYLENAPTQERDNFIDTMRVLLPMLYLKTSLLKKEEVEGYNDEFVTESDYNFVRSAVAGVMKENDDFLDVFVEDFKYSDQPILCTVSECLADVYQAVRNAVEVFREGYEEAMQVAVVDAIDSFEQYWGQQLLNALRALHDVRFSTQVD